MAENLRVTHYRSGAPIPNVTDDQEWSSLDGGAYSYYEHEPGNIALYGLLYNWFAVDDAQGICPAGWHVPSDEEWQELEMHLGMSQDEAGRADPGGWRGTDEGGTLKATGTSHWQSPNTGATNASGFSALPGGGRPGYGIWGGGFYYKGQKASLWTSSEHDATEAWMRNLDYDSSGVRRRTITKRNGFSVRCVQDRDAAVFPTGGAFTSTGAATVSSSSTRMELALPIV